MNGSVIESNTHMEKENEWTLAVIVQRSLVLLSP